MSSLLNRVSLFKLSASPADPAGSKDFVYGLQPSPLFNVSALFGLQSNGQLFVNPPGLAYNLPAGLAVYVLTVSGKCRTISFCPNLEIVNRLHNNFQSPFY